MRKLIAIAAAVAMSACGGGGGGDSTAASSATTTPSTSGATAAAEAAALAELSQFISTSQAAQVEPFAASMRALHFDLARSGLNCGSVDTDQTVEQVRSYTQATFSDIELQARRSSSGGRWKPAEFGAAIEAARTTQLAMMSTNASLCPIPAGWAADLATKRNTAVNSIVDAAVSRLRQSGVIS